ncbi:MAG TPA: hypothetical protein VIL86_00025 [Tepidisphaeraceae bacterium]
MNRLRSTLITAIGCLAISLLATGCGTAGYIASAMPAPDVDPQYKGLAGHSVGVMVWADRGIRTDWGSKLQVDLASSVQQAIQIKQTAKKKPPEELKGVTWPVEAASIVKYQLANPKIETMPLETVAPHLGVERLIYVEIGEFSTRSSQSVELYRGSASISIRLIEISGAGENRKAKMAFQEDNIRMVFPEKGPEEGTPNATDESIYRGLVQEMAKQVSHRFVTWNEDEDKP